ncbi:MAG: tRNA (adenosine(37)-N6)-threonylcarbamoyltransferase complex dimerization subunit type 1 TsaB [Candidatus Edwardsbacteria bacterium]|nr:tRNA (adenosine(37)-N6)-threonylcarbamoyltransferase complex dimerization subunit type 1 TsaB [Candidatus Edwardsbacteria bacterium]
MMYLCLDTSGIYLNIAVCRQGKVLAGLSREVGAGHSEILAAETGALLKSHDIKLSDIGLLAAATGPGSFTGLRVGIAFVKGLAAGLKLPALSLNTLDVMAGSQETKEAYLSPMIDAKKKEIYTALYKMKDGQPVRESDYLSIGPEKWLAMLPEDALLFGSGEANYRELFRSSATKIRQDEDFLSSGRILSGLAVLAHRLYQEDQAVDPRQLDAFYVRPADAIIKK